MTTENQQVVKKTEAPVHELVLSRVNDLVQAGGLTIAPDFNAANALRSAYLVLSDMRDAKTGVPVLQVVKKESVMNALFKMCVEGLNVAKQQAVFIQYGDKIHLQRQYQGNIMLARRYGNLKDIYAGTIYEGDVFEYEINPMNAMKRIVKHEQKFENINEDHIKAVYAVSVFNDGSTNLDIMTWAQVQASWRQSQSKGESPAHKNFKSVMAQKTIINRALKLLIATSDDSVLMQNDNGLPMEPSKLIEEPVQYATDVEPEVIDIPEEPQVVEPPKADPLKAQGNREWKKPEVEKTPEKAPF